MKFTPRDIPDLTGHVAVVTGANSGLGLATAWMLGGAGAHVVMTARSREKFEAACAEVTRRHSHAHVSYQELDLADLEQVADAAESLRGRVDRIDMTRASSPT